MKFLLKIALLLITLFWQLATKGQTDAGAVLDTNAILIGDQINLELSFTCPADYKVEWPKFNDTIITEIEILEKYKIDTAYSDDNSQMHLRQILKITSFDSGYYAIPPFHFNYKQPDDQLDHFAETDALLLAVSTVPVDTQMEIKDIKKPIEAPYTFREALPWIIAVFVILIITYFVFYYLKKRKKAEPIFKAAHKPKLPPHTLALNALDDLRLKKIWQSGRIKEYHTELTDILREYIDGKFNIPAHELTSDEIMEAINETATNKQAKEKLRQTLVLADMVKFAKQQPLPLEHDGSLNNAYDFVKETIHLAAPAVDNQTPEQETVNIEVEQNILSKSPNITNSANSTDSADLTSSTGSTNSSTQQSDNSVTEQISNSTTQQFSNSTTQQFSNSTEGKEVKDV